MNGTKFYKLNKSNEPLLIILQEGFDKLEEKISSRITAALVSIAEIIFSAILTFFLEKEIKPFETIWCELEIFQGNTQTDNILKIVISCILIFGASILAIHLGIFLFHTIQSFFHDNKRTGKDIYLLERIFYQKVLNEITTGLSLEKKSYELTKSPSSNDSKTPTQDANLSILYLVESVFYFHEALHTIKEVDMIEPSNPNRVNIQLLLKN